MGKVGDLIVRLKLQYQDYQKGLKKAAEDTKGFSNALGKIKGAGVAVWGAIGGAALKVAADVVKATNQMQDKWEMFTNKAKAGWDTFVKTLINGNWNDFTRKFKESVIAAQYLTDALQATTEVENSILLQKAAMAEELAALEVAMRDATKTYKERYNAAQQYMQKVSPIYDQEIKRLEELKKAYMVTLGSGIYSADHMKKSGTMSAVEKFLVEYGKDTKHKTLRDRTLSEVVAKALVPFDVAPGTPEKIAEQRARQAAIEQLQWLSAEWFPKQDTNFLFNIAKNYEQNMKGEEIQALVKAIADFNIAKSKLDSETKKIQTLLSTLKKNIDEENKNVETTPTTDGGPLLEKIDSLAGVANKAIQFDVPDIIPDDYVTRNADKIDDVLAEAMRLQRITEQINSQFSQAIASSLSGATQAIAECIAGIEGADAGSVLKALLQPFATTMMQLGEMLIMEGIGIEAFKTSLASLNGAAAFAAGASLLALGAALSAGIQKLGGGTSTASAGANSEVSNSSSGYETYEQEITVHVVGEIQGDKIVISGQKALNKWNR